MKSTGQATLIRTRGSIYIDSVYSINNVSVKNTEYGKRWIDERNFVQPPVLCSDGAAYDGVFS